MSDDLAVLVSIPSLARKLGRHRNAFTRQLLKLHAIDRAAGLPAWLFEVPGDGQRRHMRVNVEALYAAHPELRRAAEERALDGVALERLALDFRDWKKASRDREHKQNQRIARLTSRLDRLESEKALPPAAPHKPAERLIG